MGREKRAWREAWGRQIHFYLNPALEQIVWGGYIRLTIKFAGLIPCTDRCHLVRFRAIIAANYGKWSMPGIFQRWAKTTHK